MRHTAAEDSVRGAYRRSGKRNIPGGFGELDWHAWWVLTEA